jgi:hypothetical protein
MSAIRSAPGTDVRPIERNITMSDSRSKLTPEQLSDRVAIIDLTLRMVEHVDLLQWDQLCSCFADDLVVNCSYVLGKDEGHVETTAAEFAEAWRRTVGGFETTQHLLANHRVTVVDTSDDQRSTATCSAYVQAQHYHANGSGDPIWTLGGHYDFELVRPAGSDHDDADPNWRISALMQTTLWETGNRHLLGEAAEHSPAAESETRKPR